MKADVERRRFRRAEMNVAVAIRRPPNRNGDSNEAVIGQVKDVSLAGVYFYTKAPCPFEAGESVVCSIAIPPEHARAFPFSRILGRGWVVRKQPVPEGRREGERPAEEKLLGLAVAFTSDITALASAKSY